jgi:PTH2 family peptidyl-tRNA hydrolase
MATIQVESSNRPSKRSYLFMMRDVKQVIVMRTDLNMRKGKMIAQGAHASIAWISDYGTGIETITKKTALAPSGKSIVERLVKELTPAQVQWLEGSFKKICVRADSEEELLEIVDRAAVRGVPCSLIQDKGDTEFHGVPTYTCLALGPDYSDKIDEITGDLKLL